MASRALPGAAVGSRSPRGDPDLPADLPADLL